MGLSMMESINEESMNKIRKNNRLIALTVRANRNLKIIR